MKKELETDTFASALTIGATGMLRGALDHIAAHARRTWIVSRHAQEAMTNAPLPNTRALDLDYAQASEFRSTLSRTLDLKSVDVALLWFHNEGLTSLFDLLDYFSDKSVRIIHVAGSAAKDPRTQAKRIASRVTLGENCAYCPVVLGAMPTTNGRRWLTHEEICAGTIKAIDTGQPQMIGHRLSDLDAD